MGSLLSAHKKKTVIKVFWLPDNPSLEGLFQMLSGISGFMQSLPFRYSGGIATTFHCFPLPGPGPREITAVSESVLVFTNAGTSYSCNLTPVSNSLCRSCPKKSACSSIFRKIMKKTLVLCHFTFPRNSSSISEATPGAITPFSTFIFSSGRRFCTSGRLKNHAASPSSTR